MAISDTGMEALEQTSPTMIFDAILVDELVGGVYGRVSFALAVFNDQLDLATENAALGIPFLTASSAPSRVD